MLTEGGYNGKQMVSPERKITLPEACWEFWVHIQACFTDLELIWYLYIQKFWVLHIWWRRRNQIFYFSWFSWENVTKNKEDSTSVLETGNFPWYQSHPDPDCPVIPYRSWKNSLEKNVTAVSRVCFPSIDSVSKRGGVDMYLLSRGTWTWQCSDISSSRLDWVWLR